MQYILYDGDDDVPQEIKNGLLIMTINRALEQELLKLWEGSVGDQSGRFNFEIAIPEEWQTRFDYPEIRFKIVSVSTKLPQAKGHLLVNLTEGLVADKKEHRNDGQEPPA